MLHSFAERGDFTNAESVIKQMNENNQLPGPKAYHALVYSYVKGGYSRGALNAIRTEVGKGMLLLLFLYCSGGYWTASIEPEPGWYPVHKN